MWPFRRKKYSEFKGLDKLLNTRIKLDYPVLYNEMYIVLRELEGKHLVPQQDLVELYKKVSDVLDKVDKGVRVV